MDLQIAGSDDTVIWAVASERSFVIVSKDSDFADRVTRDPAGPRLVWFRMGNTRKRQLVQRFMELLTAIVAELDAGERLIEVR